MVKPHLQEQIIAYRQFQMAVEEALLQGYTSHAQLAVRFGCSAPTIGKVVRRINAAWKDAGPNATKAKRLKRVRQLERVIQVASLAFERSREDAQESGTNSTESICRKCNGLGTVPAAMGVDQCPRCEGGGLVTTVVQVVRKKGQAGDSSFLTVIKNCLAEINRLEGNYPSTKVAVTGTVEGRVLHAHLISQAQDLSPAAQDAIIRARVALQDLRDKMGEGNA